MTGGLVAEELAEYFNRISHEFNPLRTDDVPETYQASLPVLDTFEVASRIRRFRKPKSMVPGDVFPQLVTQFSDFFAIPLTAVYNDITRTGVWPVGWKREYVTIIPKGNNPSTLSDLRNISCTQLASKMHESYVLDWLKSEVALRTNQYEGVKGLGTQHLLVQLYQELLENAEDYRSGTVVTSIDYSKAFNRMSFQRCLEALARNGASTGVLSLVAAFLSDRTMMVKVGSTMSCPREMHGGCPQGSILGVFLFNATVDDLEEGCEDIDTDKHRPERPQRLPAASCGGPLPSTPFRPLAVTDIPTESPIVRSRPRTCRRLNYTSESRQDLPQEPNDKTEAKWKQKPATFKKYIDDSFTLSMINFENSNGFTVNGMQHRVKHAIQSQNVFRHLVRRGGEYWDGG